MSEESEARERVAKAIDEAEPSRAAFPITDEWTSGFNHGKAAARFAAVAALASSDEGGRGERCVCGADEMGACPCSEDEAGHSPGEVADANLVARFERLADEFVNHSRVAQDESREMALDRYCPKDAEARVWIAAEQAIRTVAERIKNANEIRGEAPHKPDTTAGPTDRVSVSLARADAIEYVNEGADISEAVSAALDVREDS